MNRLSRLTMPLCVLAACSETPLEPLSELPYAYATPSCGPADAPTVSIYLAAQSFELPQPLAPFVEVHLPSASSQLKAGDVFRISELFTEASAFFHTSGVETRVANGGGVGVTEFKANILSGYVDLEFTDVPRVRGTFIAAWVPRQLLCG